MTLEPEDERAICLDHKGDTSMHNISALPLDCSRDGGAVSDEATLVRAAQEDRAAFGLLYERYMDRVYAYLRARMATEEDAADLTQQVFLQALDALAQYRPNRGSFAGWLFRIARNAAIDFHRRTRSTVTWDQLPAALQVDGRTAHDVDAGPLRQETVELLSRLVGRLDPDKREVLMLRFVAELSVADIAMVIGKSEAATKKQITRTLHTLKESYHEYTR